jgi:ATP-binding cassette subfamily B multidrug efflux pump
MWEALSDPFRYRKPKAEGLTHAIDVTSQSTPGTGIRPKQKAKNWQPTLRRIWQYLSHRKGRLSLVLLMVLMSSALTLLGPYLIGQAIDHYLEGPGGTPWLLFLSSLGVVYLLNSLVGWLQNIWMITIAQ